MDEKKIMEMAEELPYDHLISRNLNNPDIPDNVVMACKSCNSSKGDKGAYEWFKLDRRYEVPRVTEGKYLKLLYKLHSEKGTLDAMRANIERLCNVKDTIKSPVKGPINSPGKNVNLPPKNREEIRIKCWGKKLLETEALLFLSYLSFLREGSTNI